MQDGFGKGASPDAEFQGEFLLVPCKNAYDSGEKIMVFFFPRRVIKIVSKRLAKLMVQVNCMR